MNEVITSIVRRINPNINAEQGAAMAIFSQIVHNIIFSKLDE